MTQYLAQALLAGALSLAAAAPALAQAAFDPVTTDPPADAQHPATLVSLSLSSGGQFVNGRGLIAQGSGPHPTVLLLHGMPGLELNMDVAQAMRRSGWNVFTLHYRGSWGSGGEFSFKSVVEDTAAAVEFLRSSPARSPGWRVDPERIVLVGHSVGGFAALTVAAAHPAVKAVASVAGFDVGGAGVMMSTSDPARQRWLRVFEASKPLKVSDPEALVKAWAASASDIRFSKLEAPLSAKPVLLVAGTRDTIAPPDQNHEPLARALKARDSGKLTEVVLESDHSFSDKRIALTRTLLAWLEKQK